MRPENPMAAKGRIGRGRLLFGWGRAYDQRTTGVCNAASAKSGRGNADRTKLGRKQNCSENSRGRRGALRFAEEDAEAADAKWGWSKTEQRTGKEHAAWTRSEDACGGASGFSLPICAKSELAAERKGNGKAKWQSEMAKRNGKAKWAKRNGQSGMRSKALQGPSPLAFARPRRSPAKFTRSTRIRMLVCEGFRLNK